MGLEALRARQADIATELRALNDAINARNAPPPDAGGELRAAHDAAVAGDEARWTELDDEHRQNEGEILRLERSAKVEESRARWGSVRFGAPAERPAPVDVARMSTPQAQRSALEMVDDDATAGHLSGEARASLQRLVRTHNGDTQGDKVARLMLATESPAYRAAFQAYAAGASGLLNDEERNAVRAVRELRTALNITTDSQGGYAVPVLIDPTIVLTSGGTPNHFFEISRVEQITTDEWKGITGTAATWYWTTEGTSSTDGAPTLAQPSVVTKKITGWIPFSVEIQGDWPGFANEMSTVLREGYSEAVVSALTNGLGTTAQPYGIVTALEATAASQVAVTTDGVMGAVDIYALRDALPTRYQANATFMMHRKVETAIRQFGTTDPNFTVNLTAEGIPVLLGKRNVLNDYMDTPATTTASDCTLAIYGDFRNFLIAQRVGMTVEVVQHVQSSGVPTGQRGLWAWARLGSDSINDAAFRILTQY